MAKKVQIFRSLHLKIITGYALLIGLLTIIVLVTRYETDRLLRVDAGELRREESRLLINQISGKLLDMAFPGELLPLWDQSNFECYHKDNQCAIILLNKLREFYPDHSQCLRIDSVCSLLKEKERQLGMLYGLLKPGNEGLYHQASLTSAYADTLKRRNEELNYRLDFIIHDFEAVAARQAQSEREERTRIRQSSFRILSSIMSVAFLLATGFYILIHRDIRRRINYRRKLESANHDNRQLLDLHRRMVLSILHDLRSPLGIISGYAEMVKDEPDGQKRNMQANNILTTSAHMLSLTEDLLEYYRLNTGAEQPSPVAFSPDDLLQELEHDFRPMIENKGLSFILNNPSKGITLEGDRERLYRISSNLLSNAVKFTTTGTITVTIQHREGMLRLQVQDTGNGMNAEEITRVFNAFERLDNSGKVAGFGLGLSITSGLVTLLGGSIRVESRPVVGSLFTVDLPMPQTTTYQKRKAAKEAGFSNYPLRILAIDDDRMQQTLLCEMLRRQGITCDCCDHAGEVMERLRNERYDLLITDIQMPVTDGFALLRMLRESDIPQANTISVLAMTARIDLLEADYIEKGFAGYLCKPFTLSTLLTAITGEDCRLANGEDISFEMLLREEKDQGGMLELFIHETRKAITLLNDAVQANDPEALSSILHKIRSLWAALGVHIPDAPTAKDIPAILRQGEWLILRATGLRNSTTPKIQENEKDTDR